MAVVLEGVLGDAGQLHPALAGVVGGGEAVGGPEVAPPVGVVEVPRDQDAVAEGEDRAVVVHQPGFEVLRGAGGGEAVGLGLGCGLAVHLGFHGVFLRFQKCGFPFR